jgi:hypothetical protein
MPKEGFMQWERQTKLPQKELDVEITLFSFKHLEWSVKVEVLTLAKLNIIRENI